MHNRLRGLFSSSKAVVIVVALIAALLPLLWLRSGELLIGTDVLAPLNPVQNYSKVLKLWDETDGVGRSYAAGLYLPRWFLWGIPVVAEKLSLPPRLGEVLTISVLLAGWVVALGFLLRGLKLERWGLATGLVFGLFNPFIVERAHDTETLATLILSALLLGALARVRNHAPPLREALLSALPTLLLPVLNPSTRLAGLALAMFVGGWWFIRSTPPQRQGLLRFGGWYLLIVLILNLPFLYAYWVFLQRAGELATAAGAGAWLGGVSSATSIWNVVRLIGAWDWFATFSGEAYVPLAAFYRSTGGILLTLVPLILVLFGAFLRRRWSIWHTLLVAGIFLAAGTHPPFGGLYQWLFDNVPGFNIFRSPWYKFSLWLVLGYAVLLSFAAQEFVKRFKSLAGRVVAGLIIFGLLIGGGWPLFTGARYPRVEDRANLSALRVEIPSYAYAAAEWVRQRAPEGRVLLVPQHRFNSSQHTWGYGNLVPIQHLLFDPVGVVYRDFQAAEPENALLDGFEAALQRGDPAATQYLRGLGVKFVLVQEDFAYRAFNAPDESAKYAERLATIAGLTRAERFGPWQFWEVTQDPPRALFAPYAAALPTETALDPLVQRGEDAVFVTGELPDELNSTTLLFGRWEPQDAVFEGDRMRVRLEQVPMGAFRRTYRVTSEGDAGELFVDGKAFRAGNTAELEQQATFELALRPSPLALGNGGFATTADWTVVAEKPEAVRFTSPNGEHAALTVSGAEGTIYQALRGFDAAKGYLVQMRYRTEGTATWAVGIQEQGPAPSRKALSPRAEWGATTAYVQVQEGFASAQLEISGSGTGTIFLDEITVQAVQARTALVVTPVDPLAASALNVQEIGRGRYRIQGVASRDGVIAFNQGYAPGWRAFEGNRELFHFRAQGYANGWRLPHDGPFTIEVRYGPQQTFENLLLLSIMLVVIAGVIAAIRRFGASVSKERLLEPRWVMPLGIAMLGLLALVPLLWFRQGTLITGADINFPTDPTQRFFNRLWAWDPAGNAGQDQTSLFASLAFHGVQAGLSALGAGLVWTERLELVFWNALIGISFFVFMRELLGKRHTLPALGATAFWLFNPYRIVMWTETNVAMIAATIALPLWLWIGLRVARGGWQPFWGGVAVGGVLLLCSGIGLNPPMLVLGIGAVGLLFLGGILRFALSRDRERGRRWIQFGLWAVLWSFILNAFWIIPFLTAFFGQYRAQEGLAGFNLLNWVEGLSRNTSLWNVARLQGAWDWYENYKAEPYIPYARLYRERFDLLLLSVLPPLGFVAGMWLGRARRWWVWWATILVVIGVGFGMGVHPPMRPVFEWASNNVPGFWMFRSPWYKFTLLTTLGYGVGIGFALVALGRILRTRWYTALVIGFIVLAIGSGFPLISGKHLPTAQERTELNNFHVQIPAYVFEATRWLNAQPDQGKVLFLPKEAAYNYTWGYGGAGDVSFDLIQRPIVTPLAFSVQQDSFSAARLIDLAYSYLYERRHDEALLLLRTLDVRYILHKRDSRWDFYQNPDSPEFVRERLAAFPEIERVNTFGEWDIYRIKGAVADAGVGSAAGVAYIQGTTADFVAGLTLANAAGLAASFAGGSPSNDVLQQSKALVSFADPQQLREEGDTLQLELNAPQDGTYELVVQGSFRNPFRISVEDAVFISSEATAFGGAWYRLGEVTLSAGVHTATIQGVKISENLIENPAFDLTDGNGFRGWTAKDCDIDAPGRAQFTLESTSGGDGSPAAQLRANSHVLCLAQKITKDFYPEGIYKLSFDARWSAGAAPAYTVWQQGPQAPRPQGSASRSSDWQRVEVVFKPEVSTTALEFFLYADGRGAATTNAYDNIRLVRLSDSFTSIGLRTVNASGGKPPALTVAQRSPTKRVLDLRGVEQGAVVALLTGYHPGWKAMIIKEGARQVLPSSSHFAYAGYANGWILPQGGEMRVILNYQPQTIFAVGLLLALGGICTVGLIAVRQRRRKRD